MVSASSFDFPDLFVVDEGKDLVKELLAVLTEEFVVGHTNLRGLVGEVTIEF